MTNLSVQINVENITFLGILILLILCNSFYRADCLCKEQNDNMSAK